MPQGRNKPADPAETPQEGQEGAQEGQEARQETQEEKRLRERKEAAQKSAEGYEPREGAAFEGSRGYVLAQFEIAAEVDKVYQQNLKDRQESREVLKSLFHQRLLTPDEAVLMFEVYPERAAPPNKKNKATNGDGTEAAQEGAGAAA